MKARKQAPVYTNLPYLHPKISPDDLDENGMLTRYNQKFTLDGKEYAVYTTLGEGDYGSVKLAQDSSTRDFVAVKVMHPLYYPSAKETAAKAKDIETEYQLQKKAHVAKAKKGSILVMSLISGEELYKFTKKIKNLSPKQRFLTDAELLQIAIGQCEAINDLNVNFGILLRDIKLENFIYNPVTGRVIATDYGLACEAGKDINLRVKCGEAVGNELTMAPESKKEGIYSKLSESYSVGQSIACLLNDKLNKKNEMLIDNDDLRKNISDVLLKMTLDDPLERITLDQAATELRKIQKKFIMENQRDLQVCVLDIKYFSNNFEKNSLINRIKDFDRILLINSGDPLSQTELSRIKLQIEKGLLDVKSPAKVSSTVISELTHDELVIKACTRMKLESRRGAYSYNFSEMKDNGLIYNLPSTEAYNKSKPLSQSRNILLNAPSVHQQEDNQDKSEVNSPIKKSKDNV